MQKSQQPYVHLSQQGLEIMFFLCFHFFMLIIVFWIENDFSLFIPVKFFHCFFIPVLPPFGSLIFVSFAGLWSLGITTRRFFSNPLRFCIVFYSEKPSKQSTSALLQLFGNLTCHKACFRLSRLGHQAQAGNCLCWSLLHAVSSPKVAAGDGGEWAQKPKCEEPTRPPTLSGSCMSSPSTFYTVLEEWVRSPEIAPASQSQNTWWNANAKSN